MVQDYQVNVTPNADKLEFAKSYLQQEINGLEGILNAVEFQVKSLLISCLVFNIFF